MNPAVTAALIGAVGLILSGVLVELIRTRRRTDQLLGQVQPDSGGSMREDIKSIKNDVHELRDKQGIQADRLTRVETILTERFTDRFHRGRDV